MKLCKWKRYGESRLISVGETIAIICTSISLISRQLLFMKLLDGHPILTAGDGYSAQKCHTTYLCVTRLLILNPGCYTLTPAPKITYEPPIIKVYWGNRRPLHFSSISMLLAPSFVHYTKHYFRITPFSYLLEIPTNFIPSRDSHDLFQG